MTSIALAAYNGEKYIREQLDSILAQTVTDWELVACDDRSSDGTLTILREYATRDGRIRVYANERNLGFRKNFERAMSLCRGDYIAFSDQDTIYPADYVPTVRRILGSGNLDTDALAALVPTLYDKVAGELSLVTVKSKLGIRTVFPKAPYTKFFQAIASGMVIKAQSLRTIGGMDETLFIDWGDFEWCWKANMLGKHILCCRDLNICHRIGDSSGKIGKKKYSMHSHIRNYYITRNAFYLAVHTKYLSLPDKLLLFVRSFRFIPLYTLLCHEHLLNLRYTAMGMLDELRGRMGRLREPARRG